MHVVFSPDGLSGAGYILGVNCDTVPPNSVEIADAAWFDFVNHPGARRWDGSKIVAYTPPSSPDTVVITSSVTFWRRTTEREATIIESGIEALPIRKRRLVNAAKEFWSTDEFYSELRGFLVQVFGTPRADELLAAG